MLVWASQSTRVRFTSADESGVRPRAAGSRPGAFCEHHSSRHRGSGLSVAEPCSTTLEFLPVFCWAVRWRCLASSRRVTPQSRRIGQRIGHSRRQNHRQRPRVHGGSQKSSPANKTGVGRPRSRHFAVRRRRPTASSVTLIRQAFVGRPESNNGRFAPMLLQKSPHAVVTRQAGESTSQIGLQTARKHRLRVKRPSKTSRIVRR